MGKYISVPAGDIRSEAFQETAQTAYSGSQADASYTSAAPPPPPPPAPPPPPPPQQWGSNQSSAEDPYSQYAQPSLAQQYEQPSLALQQSKTKPKGHVVYPPSQQ